MTEVQAVKKELKRLLKELVIQKGHAPTLKEMLNMIDEVGREIMEEGVELTWQVISTHQYGMEYPRYFFLIISTALRVVPQRVFLPCLGSGL